jgi:PH (Pleckstrin Homology) domain-containing protein
VSPRAESAEAPPVVASAASEKLLHEGELILLAIKPSGWYVVLVSWPVLVVTAAIAAGAILASQVFNAVIPGQMICLLCLAAAAFRVAWACGQWVGKLYMLTSRRVVSIRGVGRVTIEDCPLTRIGSTHITHSTGERLLGIGTLAFRSREEGCPAGAWEHLSQPADVRELVEEAIRRAT